MKRRHNYSLSIPGIKEMREAIEKGDIGRWLTDQGEKTHADSVRVKYTLKKLPWIVSIEAKRINRKNYGNR